MKDQINFLKESQEKNWKKLADFSLFLNCLKIQKKFEIAKILNKEKSPFWTGKKYDILINFSR